MSIVKRILKFFGKVFIATTAIMFSMVFVLIVGSFIFAGFFGGFASYLQETQTERKVIYGKEDANNLFVSIPVKGIIVGDSSDLPDPLGLLHESITYGYEVKSTLRDLAEDKEVKGIILEINSPGGTIYGAKAIADGIEEYKRLSGGKPVISFISGLAASGGYWAAIAGDKVFADHGVSIGSIGVISGPFQFYDKVMAQDGGILSGGVVTQNGIQTIFISAGKYKDFGNPFRKLTNEELTTMQTMVNNEYESFVEYVASRRKIEKQVIRDDIGALLYDTKTGKEKKLIDDVLNKDHAYKEAAKLAGISDDHFVVVEQSPKKSVLMSILESKFFSANSEKGNAFCSLSTARLVYHGDVSSLCR
ncbi:MAG: S49 family peptidase [Patescibacteria group bacterium]|nr:S49 family peptidase [Patescibacteria group bacterium]